MADNFVCLDYDDDGNVTPLLDPDGGVECTTVGLNDTWGMEPPISGDPACEPWPVTDGVYNGAADKVTPYSNCNSIKQLFNGDLYKYPVGRAETTIDIQSYLNTPTAPGIPVRPGETSEQGYHDVWFPPPPPGLPCLSTWAISEISGTLGVLDSAEVNFEMMLMLNRRATYGKLKQHHEIDNRTLHMNTRLGYTGRLMMSRTADPGNPGGFVRIGLGIHYADTINPSSVLYITDIRTKIETQFFWLRRTASG